MPLNSWSGENIQLSFCLAFLSIVDFLLVLAPGFYTTRSVSVAIFLHCFYVSFILLRFVDQINQKSYL